MAIVTDLRAVSVSAIEQLVDRWDDLPRSLLAAIGAGDLAVGQLAALRASLSEQLVERASRPVDVRAFTTDLPGRAQKLVGDLGRTPESAAELSARAQQVAAEVSESIQSFAAQVPARTQELVVELPTKIAEFSGDLTVETVRDTLQAYTQLVAVIYGSLADRGDRTWTRVRSASLEPGTVVDAAVNVPRVAKAAAKAPQQTAAAVSPRRVSAARVTTAAPATARAARAAARRGGDAPVHR